MAMEGNTTDETIANGKDSADSEIYAPEYRDRLRTWLVKMIHSGTIPGLVWENDENTIFRMPWKHAGRQDYNLDEDSKIFMAWAKHSGRYREGIDKPEPIVWKTRLRCALNKMPDIRELPDRSRLDISEPYRVYQLLPPVHKASQIRRRLYKRSQSHDTDHMTSSSSVSPTSSYLHPMENESWTKPFSTYRRNNSSEGVQRFTASPPQPRAAPLLTSSTSQLNSPAFWFSQTGGIPFKPPMSSAMLPLPLPTTDGIPQDPAHVALPDLSPINARYPMLPGFHSSFAAAATVPPVFSASQGLRNPFAFNNPAIMGPLKHMTAQAIAVEQKYQEQLTFARKLENENNKLRSEERKLYRRLDQLEKNNGFDSDEIRKNCDQLYTKLGESQRRIETLESEVSHFRSAHAREREAREKLEVERERMKSVLEHMGEGLRNLAVHMHPQSGDVSSSGAGRSEPRDQFSLNRERAFNEISKQLAINGINVTSHVTDDVTSPPPSSSQGRSPQRRLDDFRGSPLPRIREGEGSTRGYYNPNPVEGESPAAENLKRKRVGSPLDLTVASPAKLRRTSGDDSDRNSPVTPHSYPGQSKSSPPSLLYVSAYGGNYSPEVTSREESSTSSASPDHVIRRGSISPPQRSPHMQSLHLSHHGTIQVS